MFTALKSAEMDGLAVGGVVDDIRIRFEHANPKQPIAIGWLLIAGNPQPNVIRIEIVRHRNAPSDSAAAPRTREPEDRTTSIKPGGFIIRRRGKVDKGQ